MKSCAFFGHRDYDYDAMRAKIEKLIVYLLERDVPRRYAIVETNKCLADRVDLLVSGVVYGCGGAYQAVKYAERHGKEVIWLRRE